MEGKDLLCTLVKEAGDDIDIMIGSGVKASVIEELAPLTGATTFTCPARSLWTAQ